MNQPCPTCPFREVNRGKPNPPSNMGDIEQAEWYSQENIDGIWRGMRHKGEVWLSCHTTDPDYFGREDQPVYACVGAAIAVYIHYKIFEKLEDYDKYIEAVGVDNAFVRNVLGEKSLALLVGHTSILWGSMILPKVIKNLSSEDMRWPTGFDKALLAFKQIHDEDK